MGCVDGRKLLISVFLSTLASVQRLTERMLCPADAHRTNCQCDQLKTLYGSKLYKCHYLHCPMFRDGFDDESQRNEHLSTHSQYSMDPKGLVLATIGGDQGDDDDDDHHDDRPMAGRGQHTVPETMAPTQEEMVYSSVATYTTTRRR